MKKSVLEKVRKDRETMSISQLAIKYKLSHSMVYRNVKDVYNPNNDRRKKIVVDLEKVEADYFSGKSVIDIAKEQGCSPAIIYVNLRDKMKEKGRLYRLPKRSLDELVDYRNGMSQSAIARKYGVSRQSVSALVNKHSERNLTVDQKKYTPSSGTRDRFLNDAEIKEGKQMERCQPYVGGII
jgi:DNA invertase Pin-like site-specific DNA recombinase